jgi:hypothetical protein
MPVNDWQFLVVTAAMLGALAWLFRTLRPSGRRKTGGCASCTAGSAAARNEPTSLTVEGRSL